MSERDDRERVEAILRERGFTLDPGDVDALAELVPVFRSLAERLREIALHAREDETGTK